MAKTINFEEGIIDVTDPCYGNDKDTWCALRDLKIAPGKYNVESNVIFKKMHNGKGIVRETSDLSIYHSEIKPDENTGWKLINSDICVDGGTCGIYKPNSIKNPDATKNLVGKGGIVAIDQGGIYTAGQGITVTSLDDSLYALYGKYKNGSLVALQLRFASEKGVLDIAPTVIVSNREELEKRTTEYEIGSRIWRLQNNHTMDSRVFLFDLEEKLLNERGLTMESRKNWDKKSWDVYTKVSEYIKNNKDRIICEEVTSLKTLLEKTMRENNLGSLEIEQKREELEKQLKSKNSNQQKDDDMK